MNRLIKTEERRKEILRRLQEATEPVSAKIFAIDYRVSRQVIVQDMAVIRAAGNAIISTSRGYMIENRDAYSREMKMVHGDDRVEEELQIIVDLGGRVKNVSISHRIYGRITAQMDIASRRDITEFLERMEGSSSKLLGNATAGYHYHLIEANSEERLDMIEQQLEEVGLLAPFLSWEIEH